MKKAENENNYMNTTAMVYKALRRLISPQKMSPGSKFNQGEIAKELGVSRTPVVKALHKLESEGLVDNIPQKGFFVHQLTVKELLELFTLREALDTIVIDNLVETIIPEQVKMLKEIMEPFDGNWTPELKKEYWYADQKFHNALFELCKNGLVKKVNDMFQVLNRTYQAGLIRKMDETLVEHKEIIQALRAKDSQAARIAVVEHSGKTRKLLQSAVNKLRKLGIDSDKLSVNDLPIELLRE